MGSGNKREGVVKAARSIVRCAVQAEDAAKTVKRFGNVEQSLRGGMQFYAGLQVVWLWAGSCNSRCHKQELSAHPGCIAYRIHQRTPSCERRTALALAWAVCMTDIVSFCRGTSTR